MNISGNNKIAGLNANLRSEEQLSPETTSKLQELRKHAEEFEAIFVNLMLKSMRDTVPKGGFLESGNGEEIFRSMLDQEYSKTIASQRFSGIADAIERDMKKLVLAGESVNQRIGADQYLKAGTKANESRRVPK